MSPPSQLFDLHTNNDFELHFVPITRWRIRNTRTVGGIALATKDSWRALLAATAIAASLTTGPHPVEH